MNRTAIIIEAAISFTVAVLFIWGFLTGPEGWGWQAFAWLVGIK